MDEEMEVEYEVPPKTKEDAEVHESLPFVEKYRPECLDDVISHQEIILTSK